MAKRFDVVRVDLVLEIEVLFALQLLKHIRVVSLHVQVIRTQLLVALLELADECFVLVLLFKQLIDDLILSLQLLFVSLQLKTVLNV